MSIFAQLLITITHHDQHQRNIHHYFFIPVRPSYCMISKNFRPYGISHITSSCQISGHIRCHLSLHHVGFQAYLPDNLESVSRNALWEGNRQSAAWKKLEALNFVWVWKSWEKKSLSLKIANIQWKHAGKLKYSYIPLQNAGKLVYPLKNAGNTNDTFWENENSHFFQ